MARRKKTYRIRNWSDYNKALVQRGSLTIWLDQKSISTWYHDELIQARGRPQRYSDLAIETCLTLKALLHLPLRATQGLVDSLLGLMQLSLIAPDYSLLCRRQKNVRLNLPKQATPSAGMHLVIDSTGLKVYGEGEWKVRKHGAEKRRTWLKLHLGINAANHDIHACIVTGDDVHDSETLPALLNQVTGTTKQVTGDGAYDTHDAYLATINKGATPCFPPRKNATRNQATDEA